LVFSLCPVRIETKSSIPLNWPDFPDCGRKSRNFGRRCGKRKNASPAKKAIAKNAKVTTETIPYLSGEGRLV
jgi:hypothetical protein